MKKPSLSMVILDGICAVAWTAKTIVEIVYQTYLDSVFWFVLNMLCGLLWIGAFVVNLKRYCSGRTDE